MAKTEIPPIAIDLDGGTDIGAAIVDADLFLIDDGAGGTMRKTAASRIKTYIGITEADQWRITSNFTASSGDNVLNSNWERDDQGAFDKLGTGMSESSGIFSFPSTGYWFITGNSTHYKSAGYEYATNRLYATVDNSNYASVAASAQGSAGTGAGYSASGFQFIFDVENITNCKVKFHVETSTADVVFMGNTDENWTWLNFIRLGDT